LEIPYPKWPELFEEKYFTYYRSVGSDRIFHAPNEALQIWLMISGIKLMIYSETYFDLGRSEYENVYNYGIFIEFENKKDAFLFKMSWL